MAIRIVSAVLAALILLGLGAFGGPPALSLSCAIAMVLSTREFARMIFPRYRMPVAIVPLYWVVSILFFTLTTRFDLDAELTFALANVAFFVAALWLARGRVENDDLLPGLALGTFGLLYCALFPLYAARLAEGPHGVAWFAYLMLVVFAGDTFAYFAGRFFGKSKLMPAISPNKTWAGSLGGLVGSGLIGTALLAAYLPEIHLGLALAFSLVCGFSAQCGDLIVSLVKRVARVKDSGRIMPGHGGVLDRLDGIFIACPLVYAFSSWVAGALGTS